MKYTNLEKAKDYEVEKWLIDELKLTEDQKRSMRNNEIIRWSPFDFYKDKKHNPNFLLRLTIIFFPIVFILLLVGLLVNFILKGKWGYEEKQIKWYNTWITKLGL